MKPQHPAYRQRQIGFACSRRVIQKHMPLCQQRCQQLADNGLFACHAGLDFPDDRFHDLVHSLHLLAF